MDPLMYWIVFCILVSLLVIFISYIVFNVILDNCLVDPEDGRIKSNQLSEDDESNDECRLNKYQFHRDDVEDLTRIQGDFKTVLPNIICANEVKDTHLENLLRRKESNSHEHPASSLSNIDEEGDFRYSKDDIHSLDSVSHKTNDNISKFIKEKKGISQSVDDLEFCDPKAIDVLKTIHTIKEKARQKEEELNYFIGGHNNVKFYELNEHFLRLMISLCDVVCETPELRKTKAETLEYIENCQKKLKDKAQNIS